MPDSRFASLTPLFAPRSVAVLGASSDPTRISGRPIAYMKAHKAETVTITAKVLNMSETVVSRVYDEQMGAFSTDGTFNPQGVAVLKKSFIDTGVLKDVPDDKEMFTTQFVPVKVSQQ